MLEKRGLRQSVPRFSQAAEGALARQKRIV
jgi:hypothetical protein